MKRFLALALAIVMIASICVLPAMAADEGKKSPEKDETVVIPDSSTGTAVIDGTTVEFSYNHPKSHPYVFVFVTDDGYAVVWAPSDDASLENGVATLPENSYVAKVSSIEEVEDMIYGKPAAVAVEIAATLAANGVVIDPSTIDDYYAKNVYGGEQKPDAPKPDDKPVTSPDTSDALSALIGTLALTDGALICYYLKKKKVK